jgi:hypothetical protein
MLLFSTRSEPDGSSAGRRLYVQLGYGTFYKHRSLSEHERPDLQHAEDIKIKKLKYN